MRPYSRLERVARKFQVPLNAFSYRIRESTAYKQFQEVAPGIKPEEYDALQDRYAKHIIAVR